MMGDDAVRRDEPIRGEGREGVFYAVLPYALLTACTVITLLEAPGGTVDVLAVLGLTIATVLWIVGFSVLRRKPRKSGFPHVAYYYVGLMLLATALIALAPWYAIFAFIGYVHAFLFLTGRWRYLGVVVTSMIMAVGYMGGFDEIHPDKWTLWAAISTVTILLASASFHFTDTTDVSGRQQRRALAELHAANSKLESALEENSELQAQLLTRAREAGVLDERQRMARDIHDTLAQSLAGILTQLQAAEQTMGDPAALRDHVRSALDLAREGLVEARRTVHALGPSALIEARLPDAIEAVARRWSETAHVDAVMTTTGNPRPMDAEIEVTLLRAAQEALANVAKHAQAKRVGLTLSYMDDLVTLDVRDDGIGFEPDAARRTDADAGGFGLAGMRQRVQRFAGRLVIESEPGGGTAISAAVPLIPRGDAG